MSSAIELSALLPVYNEQECIEPVLRELDGVLKSLGRPYEIVAVDDGSTDETPALLVRLRDEVGALRILRLTPNSGQSAALGAGFRAARGRLIITLDADGQNDPAEIPRLLAEMDRVDVCCGFRLNRQDTAAKRHGSRMANAVRNAVLGESIRDTGCTLKVFKREFVQSLPLEFKGMHRFLPALVRLRGARIAEIGVRHRARAAGQSKYTNWKRLRETVADLWAVRWMQRRFKRFHIEEI